MTVQNWSQAFEAFVSSPNAETIVGIAKDLGKTPANVLTQFDSILPHSSIVKDTLIEAGAKGARLGRLQSQAQQLLLKMQDLARVAGQRPSVRFLVDMSDEAMAGGAGALAAIKAGAPAIIKVVGVLLIAAAILGGAYMAWHWGDPESDPVAAGPRGRGIALELLNEHRSAGPRAAYLDDGSLSSSASYDLRFELKNDSDSALHFEQPATLRTYGNGGVIREGPWRMPREIPARSRKEILFVKILAPKEKGYTWMIALDGEAKDETGEVVRVVANASGGGE